MCRTSSGMTMASVPSGEGANGSGAWAAIEVARVMHEPDTGARGQCVVSGALGSVAEPWAHSAPAGVGIASAAACAVGAATILAGAAPIAVPGMHVDAQTPSATVRERSASSAAARRKRDLMTAIYPSGVSLRKWGPPPSSGRSRRRPRHAT